MKGITPRKIIVWIMFLILLIVFPYITNAILCIFKSPYFIKIYDWNDIIAIAIPSALAGLAVWQSAQQQNENVALQKRMEDINTRMVNMELQSGIGYFRPYFSLKDAGAEGSSRQPYPYKLSKYINLVNSGENDFFILSVNYTANGKQYKIPCSKPLYISKLSPYNEFLMETQGLVDEVNCSQIDIEIELVLKTMKGFQYKQLLFLGFENSDGIGIVNKFNTEIQELILNAD